MSEQDLFAGAPTPITDKHVYKAAANDVGFEVVAPAVARELERRVMAVMDLADRLARALQRSPFETEDNFCTRRQVMFEEYTKLKESLQCTIP